MQQNSDITNVTDFDANNSRRYLFGSQACWATTSEVQSTVLQKSDGYSSQEQQSVIASIKPPPMDVEYPTPPQAELIGHSIACASYPYSDPYLGGAVPAYSPQDSVHYNAVGASHARMALSSLPHEVMEEPVYVNPKQYHGILRRRQSRAKAEAEKRLIKSRKPYLHESRHLHAMRRARGSGGRFLNTKKLQHRASNLTSNTNTNSGPSSTVNSQSWSYSLAPKSALPSSFTNAGSSISHKEVKEPIQNMQSFQQFYPSQRGSENSMFYSFLNGRVGGGEGSRQQKLNAGVSMNRTPKNAVRIR